MGPRISISGFVRLSVHPSVGPSRILKNRRKWSNWRLGFLANDWEWKKNTPSPKLPPTTMATLFPLSIHPQTTLQSILHGWPSLPSFIINDIKERKTKRRRRRRRRRRRGEEEEKKKKKEKKKNFIRKCYRHIAMATHYDCEQTPVPMTMAKTPTTKLLKMTTLTSWQPRWWWKCWQWLRRYWCWQWWRWDDDAKTRTLRQWC